jgi:thymidylate kinase
LSGKIIVIEGIEATGKSTLAKALAEKYKGVYFANPRGDSEFSYQLYESIKQVQDEDAKTMLFIASHIVNIKRMNELKAQGNLVFCDRSLLSMSAYQKVGFFHFKELLSVCKVPDLQYDFAFILDASREVVMKRLNERGMDVLDQYFVNRFDQIRINYYASPIKYSPSMNIDTSELSKEELFTKVETCLIQQKVL